MTHDKSNFYENYSFYCYYIFLPKLATEKMDETKLNIQTSKIYLQKSRIKKNILAFLKVEMTAGLVIKLLYHRLFLAIKIEPGSPIGYSQPLLPHNTRLSAVVQLPCKIQQTNYTISATT